MKMGAMVNLADLHIHDGTHLCEGQCDWAGCDDDPRNECTCDDACEVPLGCDQGFCPHD